MAHLSNPIQGELIRTFFRFRKRNPSTEYPIAQLQLIRPAIAAVTIAVMPGNIGLPEIAIVLVIALIVFGPKRLPELGRSLGRGIREFKGSIGGAHDDDDDKPTIEPSKPAEAHSDQPAEAEVVRNKTS
jgi:sec-independent protein translocase protein TatA